MYIKCFNGDFLRIHLATPAFTPRHEKSRLYDKAKNSHHIISAPASSSAQNTWPGCLFLGIFKNRLNADWNLLYIDLNTNTYM